MFSWLFYLNFLIQIPDKCSLMRHDIPIGFHELIQKAQFQMQFLISMVFPHKPNCKSCTNSGRQLQNCTIQSQRKPSTEKINNYWRKTLIKVET